MNQVKQQNDDCILALVVDDDESHRRLVKDILELDNFSIDEAATGKEAISLIANRDYDVVLLDKLLPDMNGDQICEHVRQQLNNALLPLIIVTGFDRHSELSKSLQAGASDYIAKPINPMELISRTTAAASRKRLTDQLDNAESMLFALARMVEAKDHCTGDHCTRLSSISVALGKDLGLGDMEIKALDQGGILHDIGKLGVPDSILMKKTSLTESEWEVMRQHPVIGANLCKGLKSIQGAIPIIKYHHERWDGSGYPYNLSGDEIPLVTRVFQLADIYDALASERPYKRALSHTEIIELFELEIAKGWRDPELGRYFIDILHSRPDILAPAIPQSALKGSSIFSNASGF